MQSLGTKKSHNLSGPKNPANSWDKKKSQDLSGQKKSHATSRDKKVMQPIGTKKSRKLLSNFCQDILSLSQFTLVYYKKDLIFEAQIYKILKYMRIKYSTY